MPVFLILLIAFASIPLIELYVLFAVGSEIGIIPTLSLCIITAALGAWLIRLQGIQTIARVRSEMNQNRLPAVEMLAGAMLLATALLLLTPGFVTDALGFFILVPGVRRALATRFLNRAQVRSSYTEQPVHIIIDGEYYESSNSGEEAEPRLPR